MAINHISSLWELPLSEGPMAVIFSYIHKWNGSQAESVEAFLKISWASAVE
jgi:hypothetical protein